jgi:hypothetical protein
MARIHRWGIAFLALMGLGIWAPSASANDFFDDLIGTGGTPRQEYNEDVRQAREEYQRNVYQARENYNRDRQRAESRYSRDRYARGGGYNAYGKYVEAMRKAEDSYRGRLSRAEREYYDDQRKAQSRYERNRDREWNSHYRRNNRRRGDIWDRARNRRHQDEWYRRGRNHYPDYGYDYSDYYWDRGNYSRYHRGCNTGCSRYRPYRHGDSYRRNRVTYWSTGSDWGYYRDHNENGAGRWNLSVDFGVPGGNGYVNYDPYTYNRGHRYPYHRYRNHMNRDRYVRYNRRNDDHFRLSAGSDYYGDRYVYGDLHLTF